MRISGPEAGPACRALTGRPTPAPRRASLRRLREPGSGAAIDDALIVWFPGPGSATGEDLLELHHHGGAAVARALLDALRGLPGLRPAVAGEFTKRAFLAGKLDLAQAEAVADLVDATTRAQVRQAMRQLDGAAGERVHAWQATLLDALARVEAEIDFAADEHDVTTDALKAVRPALARAASELAAAEAGSRRAERLRDGVVVAVVGPPNAGKSSLVNLLARREVAIVTPYPGTTRDVIEVQLDLDGVPVTLLDTAGLRSSDDPIERLGIERALARAADADLVIEVRVAGEAAVAVGLPPSTTPAIVILNKIDLMAERSGTPGGHHLPVSCRTQEGIERLVAALGHAADALTTGEGKALFTRERHRSALRDCGQAVERVLAAPPDAELALVAEDLRTAVRSLATITGAVGAEDVLERVFATFCIGK